MSNLTLFERLFTPRKFRLARIWSNRELARIAGLFEGYVINVSAWEDKDKEGMKYKDYFYNAKSYSISNYGGEYGSSVDSDFHIDLEADIPEDLKGKFDVVFNHTTIEHVFDVLKAVSNLCELSRDIVIIIVPFIQQVHTSSSFSDYWRFTHHSLIRLFDINGFSVVYLTSTPYMNCSIYHLCVASRFPEKWRPKFEKLQQMVNTGDNIVKESIMTRLSSRLSLVLHGFGGKR